MEVASRRQLELNEKSFDDYRFSNKSHNPKQGNSPATHLKGELPPHHSPKYDYQAQNTLQEAMNRGKAGFFKGQQPENTQRKSDVMSSRELSSAQDCRRPDPVKIQALSKICEEYKEDLENEMKELQKQFSKPNERTTSNVYEKNSDRKTTTSYERGERGTLKEMNSRADNGSMEQLPIRNLSNKRWNEDRENQDLQSKYEKQTDELLHGVRSQKPLSKISSREQLINSSEKSSLIATPNSNCPKLWKLKQDNIDKKFQNVETGKKSVRFSHTHTELSDTPRSSSSIDPLNEFTYDECKKTLRELSKIFHIADPSQIVSCAIKTEKIMKTVPKMEKLITEVHDIVFPDVDPAQWTGNLDKITVVLKKWSQNSKTTKDLLQFRNKIASVIGSDVDSSVTDDELVAKVEKLQLKKTEHVTLPKDPNAEKYAVFFEQFKRLFRVNDCEAGVFKLNQIYRQHAELDNFKMVVSTFLDIPENIKLEDFFKNLTDIIENMKFNKQFSDSKLIETIQKQLDIKDPALLSIKIAKLIEENKALSKRKYM